ncbi:hypothetical protein L873DRAFT_1675526, partial [Choiromyces venosus 120613-1]
YYSGYKKCYAFKFQAVMTPDSILSYLTSSWFGCKGDWDVYIDSQLEYHLRSINKVIELDKQYYLYGNLAYVLSYRIVCSYKVATGLLLDPVLKTINALMSGMHISIEHSFGKTINL